MINRVKQLLAHGQPSVGTWLRFPSAEVAEMLAELGMDWLVIDADHGAADWRDVESMIRAMKGTNVVPLVRVAANDPALIHRALDRGAAGVVVPNVNTPEEARQAAMACRYPPDGSRPISLNRVNWREGMFVEHVKAWNDFVLLVCIIESRHGLAHAQEIAAVAGVDVLFIGKNDLSANLGEFRGLETPEYREAVGTIVNAARRAGKAAGYMTADAPEVLTRIDEGIQFVSAGSDARLLYKATNSMYAEIWKQLGLRKIRSAGG